MSLIRSSLNLTLRRVLGLSLLFAPGAPRALAHDDSAAHRAVAADRAGWDAVARHVATAESLLEQGDIGGALARLAIARGIAPGDHRVAALGAALALAQRDPRTADSLATIALVTGPPARASYRTRARARWELGLADGAIADFDSVVALERGHAEDAMLELAVATQSLRGPAAALDLLAAQGVRHGWTPARRAMATDLRHRLGRGDSSSPEPELAPMPLAAQAARTPSALLTDAVSAPATRGPYLQNATPTAISIRWRTASPVVGRVSVGPAGGPYSSTFDEVSATTEHEVRVVDLAPATAYSYSVHAVQDSPEPASGSRTFRTPSPAGTSGPLRVWAIGDSGYGNLAGSQVRDAWLEWSGAHREDFWLLLGDNAYTNGTDAEYQAGLFDQYPLTLSRSPLWSTRGNHDLLYAGVANDYYDLFTLPTAGECGGVPSGTEAWYSFDWGPAHFVCLDSEGSDRSLASPMLQWLRVDLASTTQPWVIGFWHHPPYTKGSHNSDNVLDSGGRMRDMRERVLPICDSLGVDLVLSGHSHSYERSALLRGHYGTSSTLAPGMLADTGDGRPDGDGAYRKSSGHSGPFEGVVYAVNGSAAQTSGGSLDHPAMVISLNVLGSMVLDIAGDRLDARFLDAAGAVRDSFALVKDALVSTPGDHDEPGLELAAPRPAPFREGTELRWRQPRAAQASLSVYDVVGRRIKTFVPGSRAAGDHSVWWDGTDGNGARVPAGAYLVQLQVDGARRARRVVRVP